jgi:hypothetical protein
MSASVHNGTFNSLTALTDSNVVATVQEAQNTIDIETLTGPSNRCPTWDELISATPLVTFSGHNECIVGDQFTVVTMTGTPGDVVEIKMSINGIIDFAEASTHTQVLAWCLLTVPSNDGSADINQVWEVADLSSNVFFNFDSPSNLFITIPGGGDVVINTSCNLENGGTNINGFLSVISVNGTPVSYGTELCAGFSTA